MSFVSAWFSSLLGAFRSLFFSLIFPRINYIWGWDKTYPVVLRNLTLCSRVTMTVLARLGSATIKSQLHILILWSSVVLFSGPHSTALMDHSWQESGNHMKSKTRSAVCNASALPSVLSLQTHFFVLSKVGFQILVFDRLSKYLIGH